MCSVYCAVCSAPLHLASEGVGNRRRNRHDTKGRKEAKGQGGEIGGEGEAGGWSES